MPLPELSILFFSGSLLIYCISLLGFTRRKASSCVRRLRYRTTARRCLSAVLLPIDWDELRRGSENTTFITSTTDTWQEINSTLNTMMMMQQQLLFAPGSKHPDIGEKTKFYPPPIWLEVKRISSELVWCVLRVHTGGGHRRRRPART